MLRLLKKFNEFELLAGVVGIFLISTVIWNLFHYTGTDVYVDKKTGCEYITHKKGGITPRLTTQGTQVCSHL